MLSILLRTVIVYLILIGTMRLMGKRQLGELEVSELVTTLLVSEIASLPIENPAIPIVYVIIPLVTILTLEVSLSVLLLKCPLLKNLASTRPSILIRHGKLDQREMQRIRITLDELISEVRQAGIALLEEVDYAILEQNGKISIIPKRSAQAPSAKDMAISPTESGIVHILVEDGRLNRYNMELMHLGLGDIKAYLKKKHLSVEEVFFLGVDDAKEFYIIKKEKKQ